MSKSNSLLTLLCTALLSGCSLMHYESDFACEGSTDFGKCVPVKKAHNEAVTGASAGPDMKPKSQQNQWELIDNDEPAERSANKPKASVAPDMVAYSRYKENEYAELRRMLVEPVTPMVKNATQMRLLITPYKGTITDKEKTQRLYMPRFVYFLADQPTFVLGEYLTPKREMIRPLIKEGAEQ